MSKQLKYYAERTCTKKQKSSHHQALRSGETDKIKNLLHFNRRKIVIEYKTD